MEKKLEISIKMDREELLYDDSDWKSQRNGNDNIFIDGRIKSDMNKFKKAKR